MALIPHTVLGHGWSQFQLVYLCPEHVDTCRDYIPQQSFICSLIFLPFPISSKWYNRLMEVLSSSNVVSPRNTLWATVSVYLRIKWSCFLVIPEQVWRGCGFLPYFLLRLSVLNFVQLGSIWCSWCELPYAKFEWHSVAAWQILDWPSDILCFTIW